MSLKKIEKDLKLKGYKIDSISGIGLDFKTIYYRPIDENINYCGTFGGANYTQAHKNMHKKGMIMDIENLQSQYYQIEKLILDGIDGDGYDVKSLNSDKEKLQFLADCFHSEYLNSYNLRQYGSYQSVLENWLRGLPSAVHIPFTNSDILDLWERKILPYKAKNECEALDRYFPFIAMRIKSLCDKHSVNLYKSI